MSFYCRMTCSQFPRHGMPKICGQSFPPAFIPCIEFWSDGHLGQKAQLLTAAPVSKSGLERIVSGLFLYRSGWPSPFMSDIPLPAGSRFLIS